MKLETIVVCMALQKIVIDTCVIESALRSSLGASYKLLSKINQSQFRFGISVPLFLEYEYRIEWLYSNKKIELSESGKDSILRALAYYCDEVSIFFKLRPNLGDKNDDMVLECAVNFNANYLITHNVRDFMSGDLSPYIVKIVTPQQYLQEINNG